jgi:hypothetical protein
MSVGDATGQELGVQSCYFPELSLAFFPFFVEIAVISVLPIVCCHRYQIDIHERSKRATPRERKERACEPNILMRLTH